MYINEKVLQKFKKLKYFYLYYKIDRNILLIIKLWIINIQNILRLTFEFSFLIYQEFFYKVFVIMQSLWLGSCNF
jgi:hypothetical protein